MTHYQDMQRAEDIWKKAHRLCVGIDKMSKSQKKVVKKWLVLAINDVAGKALSDDKKFSFYNEIVLDLESMLSSTGVGGGLFWRSNASSGL